MKQLTPPAPLTVLFCMGLLSACGNEAPKGSGAGDTEENAAAVALIAPFAGFYNLDGNWSGETGDVAYLHIDSPGADGTAPAAFYDYDDLINCIPRSATDGVVSKDPTSSRVFMDNILRLEESILTLSGSTLNIEFKDSNDIDNDQDISERISVNAQRLAVSQISDLGQPCS